MKSPKITLAVALLATPCNPGSRIKMRIQFTPVI
jgi:hypothetical protein